MTYPHEDTESREGQRHHHPHQWREPVMDALDIWVVKDGQRRLRGLAPIHNRATVFIDTEFTGFARSFFFLDVAAIRVEANGSVDVYTSKVFLDRRAREYVMSTRNGREALEVVGYNEAEWSDAPPASVVLPKLYEHCLGAALVAHNADADVSRLTTWWTSNGIPVPHTWCLPIIDTAHLARAMLPGLESYSLAALCQHYQIPEETQHRALGGAERCRACWEKLTSRA